MPLAVLHSRALHGIDAPPVAVEVHLANGLPNFSMVGLPEAEVRESRDRVRAALVTAGFEFPSRRLTVNLAPADLRKQSGRYDLPIALGILAASQQIPSAALPGYEFAGELALTGALRPVRGALALARGVSGSGRTFVLPEASAPEAALLQDLRVLSAATLLDVCAHLQGRAELPRCTGHPVEPPAGGYPDLADVRGQVQARRALELAAAGGHSLLLAGPPGTGKSMLAHRLPGLLPPLTEAEALESAAVWSLSSAGFDLANWRCRPFRSPHHTASAAALVGGGGHPKPGEISLAHRGILFLDELPEFSRTVLETLREPIETGRITLSRAARQLEYPARFQLIAAMNPCPCGYLGDPAGRCRCSPDQVRRYRARISGPLLDRIDIQVEVAALRPDELQAMPDGEPSAGVAQRVDAARTRQLVRQGVLNADLPARAVDTHCRPTPAGATLLVGAGRDLRLSGRAWHRVLKLARTLADLAQVDQIGDEQVGEAVQYRRFAAASGA